MRSSSCVPLAEKASTPSSTRRRKSCGFLTGSFDRFRKTFLAVFVAVCGVLDGAAPFRARGPRAPTTRREMPHPLRSLRLCSEIPERRCPHPNRYGSARSLAQYDFLNRERRRKASRERTGERDDGLEPAAVARELSIVLRRNSASNISPSPRFPVRGLFSSCRRTSAKASSVAPPVWAGSDVPLVANELSQRGCPTMAGATDRHWLSSSLVSNSRSLAPVSGSLPLLTG
jgi:hypothetical protein